MSSIRKRSVVRFLLFITALLPSFAMAQRQMEPLGRGVVAVRTGSSSAYISWRLLTSDPDDVAFNVFRSVNGGAPIKINSQPITNTTDFADSNASQSVSNAWFVQPIIVGGVAGPLSAPFGIAANSPARQYIPIPLQPVIGGAYPPYDVKFCWVGDLDGDGEYDYVVDRHSTTTANVNQYLQAYKLDGTFLWQIDMGPNSTLTSGNSTIVYEPSSSAISVGDKDNVTVYDMDGDGRAEVLLRTANGVVFGNGVTLTAGANNNVQFLSVVDGLTGAEITRATVPNPFIADGPLNSNAGILYGDGVHPYVFLSGENRVGDGAFQRIVTAWSYQNGQLTQRWSRAVPPGANESRGHQVRMADVNHDGIDDLIQIGSAFDGATGLPLYDTEIVHGDRYHVTDLDPDRPGLETYVIQQNNPTLLATALVDAGNGTLFKKWYAGGIVDVGRGDALDMDPRYRGVEVFSTQPGIFDCKGNQIPGATQPFPYLGIWWDADNQREILGASDGNGFSPIINKWNATANRSDRLYSVYSEGVHTAYGGRPAMFGDLIGDWREEFVVVANNYSEIRIYTTRIQATNRLYCLMQNPAYRIQCTAKGYYQASYPDFYLGEQMEPPAPPPNMNAKLVWRGSNGSVWDSVTANWFTNNLWFANNTAVAYSEGDSVLFDLTGSNASPITLSGILTPENVTVHSPKDYTFSGSGRLSGAMKLVKVGKGKLTLTGTNDFTGRTTVWEGPLVVNGLLAASPVTVRGGTWLDGAVGGIGSIGGGVTVHRGGSISPGDGIHPAGTLTISNGVTLVNGAVLRLDLSDDPTGVSKTNDFLRIAGNLTLTGTNFVQINLLSGSLAAGIYPLIEYSGTLSGSMNNLVLRGLDGIPALLTNSPGQIALVVKSTRPPTLLTWTGGQNGNAWNLATSSNWLNGAVKDVFVSGDTVRFNNIGTSNLTVNINESLIASNVIIDSTANYVFNGAGALIGSGGLSKSNSGTLTINTLNNSYTGRTIIAGGTVVVPELDAVGYPSPIGNPPAGSTNLILAGNSTLRITGESYTDRGLTVGTGTNTIEISNGGNQVTIAGQIVGTGALQKAGPGTLAITVSNSHAGGTIIKSGTIALGSVAGNQYGVGPGGVILDGGRLNLINIQASEVCAWPIRVLSTGRIDCDGRSTMSGPLTGSGTLTIFTPYVRTDFSGNWSAFTGQLLIISDNDGGDFRCNNSAGYPNARMNLANVSLQNRVGGIPTIPIGELSGDAASNISAPGGNGGIGVNWSVGGLNTSATFAGSTYNNVGLIKVGTGTWTLTGNLNHTGQTTVNGGTLVINGNAGGATGNVTVGAQGTLGGTGFIRGVTVVNGRLSPGSNGIGTITFSNNVTLNGGSLTLMEINRAIGSRDRVVAGGTISFGGTLLVTNLSGTFLPGDSFDLFDAAMLSGAFASIQLPPLPAGLVWDTTQLNASGTISVIEDPSSGGPRELVWKGDGAANLWDVTTSANWLATNGAATFFKQHDVVTFNDAGSNNVPVIVSGVLNPAALNVNATKNYTFAGSGVIAGTNNLVKSGSGTLTLLNSNTFTGETIISGGTLRIDSVAAGLKHRWSFNGNLLDSVGGKNASIVDGGINDAFIGSTAVTLTGGARASSDYINLGSNLLPKGTTAVTIELWARQDAIQNWSRIFDFGSSTTENLMMSWSQGTTLASDRVEWKDAVTSTVDNSNQPYTLGTEFHIAMVIEPNAGPNGTTRVTWYRAPSSSPTLGAARGSFNSTNTLAAFNDSVCWLGRSQYTSDNTASATYNEVRIWHRALSAADLQLLHSIGPDAVLSGNLPVGTPISITGSSSVLQNASGRVMVAGRLNGGAGSEVRLTAGELVVGTAGSNDTFAGSITGTNRLTKLGTGTLTLAGTNSFSGGTIVSNGTLTVDGSLASGATVWNATLAGSGTVTGTIVAQSGATISPGNGIGTLTANNGVMLMPGSVLLMEIGGVPLTNDILRSGVPLTFGGQLIVINAGGSSLQAGDHFQLFEAPDLSGTFQTLSLPALGENLHWNTDRLGLDGMLWVLSGTPPLFQSTDISSTGIVFNGTGGTPGWDYVVLTTTNLSLPLSSWTRLLTNQFDALGNFSVTNAFVPGTPQQFFRIEVTSAGAEPLSLTLTRASLRGEGIFDGVAVRMRPTSVSENLPANIPKRVEHELNRHRGEQKSHDARDDFHGDRVQPARALCGDSKHQVAHERHGHDADVKSDAVPDRLRLALKKNRGRNRAGPGEHWNREWRNCDVLLVRARFRFFHRFLHARTLSAQHVQCDEQENDAGCNLKRGHRDAENSENPFPENGERQKNAGHHTAGKSRHP